MDASCIVEANVNTISSQEQVLFIYKGYAWQLIWAET